MHWVVQRNFHTEDLSRSGYGRFLELLAEMGIRHTVVQCVPFSHELIPEVPAPEWYMSDLVPANMHCMSATRFRHKDEPLLDFIPNDWFARMHQVVAFGSTSMSDVARKRGWTPGVWLNDNFDQRVWSKTYGSLCLNADAEFCNFDQISPFDGQRFIRPVHDLKAMNGSLVDFDWVRTQQERLAGIKVDFRPDRRVMCVDTPVSVSAPKELLGEWRFFVVEGEIRAGSMYRFAGARCCEITRSEAVAGSLAQKLVDVWQPSKAFVLDVAETVDGFRVIEINCINNSGFYACDIRPIIEAVEGMGN